MIAKQQFIHGNRLRAAVVKQLGGWPAFIEAAPDIADHGVDGGFHGFIYHSDTVEFAWKHRREIISQLLQAAEELGMDAAQLVVSFKCLNREYTANDIIRELTIPGRDKLDAIVWNALAWYAAENTAWDYVCLLEDA